MKKALIYALALALAVSLTACGQPKTEQPTDPAPSTSAPEPIATPEPIKDTTPEPEPEQTPAAPVETEDTQPPEETESEEVESQVEQVQLFTDCNETVYATGTVNIRASYTADSEKLGSLNKGDSSGSQKRKKRDTGGHPHPLRPAIPLISRLFHRQN